MRVSRALLCMALLALLCVSVMGFNPYADEDDQVQGETPKTSTIECKKDPATGEEKCESITKIVPDEEELERKMEQVEREREELAAKRAEAKRIRDEKYAEEREAKRQAKDKKRKEREEADAEKKKKGPSQDDYKIKAPLKKLRMDYYKFFGVERDAPKLKVRKAANQLAAENHPDKCPTAACRDKMVVLNAARDVLLNDETRDEYDFLLRFGFKIYDKELYEDIKKAFEEDPDNVPDGFDEDFYDPTTDPYESMALTEESAGWLLLITGSITLAMLAWPIIKFWEKSQTAEAKKAALKKEMLASQAKGLENLGSMKKKTEKYVGDRTVKRFNDAATSPRGPTTPSAAAVRSPSNKATAAVALVCILGFMSLLSTPVTAATFGSPKEISLNYYELLEVASGVETSALKRAYRSAALKWHPDRFVDRPSEQEEASAKFILIAEAYDVLSDSIKRAEYDVLLSHGFLKYDPREYASIQNARNTEWGKRAGFTFRRSYPPGEEPDDTWMLYVGLVFTVVSISVPLYQWMMKRNKAMAKKKESSLELKEKLAQNKRVLEERLASMAEAAAKAAAAAEKEEEAQAAAATAEEENEDKEGKSSLTPEQQQEREEKRQVKAQHKKTKILLRTLLRPLLSVTPAPEVKATNKKGKVVVETVKNLTSNDVDLLTSELPLTELESLIETLWPILGSSVNNTTSASGELSSQLAQTLPILSPALLKFRAAQQAAAEAEALRIAEKKLAAKKAEEAALAAGKVNSSSTAGSSKAVEWTPVELSALAKGTAKFVGGVSNRWERITDLVNQSGGHNRTVKEVLAKSREQDIFAPLKKNDNIAYETYLERMKKQDASHVTAAAPAPVASQPKPEPTKKPAAAATTPVTASTTASSDTVVPEADEWNAEQQAALELALRSVPKTAEDRWDQIAKLVPGKTKKQVITRFKMIKAQILAASGASA